MGLYTLGVRFWQRHKKASIVGLILFSVVAAAAVIPVDTIIQGDLTVTGLTASRAIATDANKKLVSSNVTSTELGYLDGVTSAIQTQLDTKAPLASPTFTGTITTPLTASRAVVTGASGVLSASTATSTEVAHLVGVASSLCGITDTCTETNKTLTSPIINGAKLTFGTPSDTNYLKLPSDTTTNLDALTDAAGLLAYDSTQGKPVYNNGTSWQAVGTGSGSGETNYIDNGNFENALDTDKVFTFDDDSSYTDGTGGTASAITAARNSTTPLQGDDDLKISKSASDCTGEGVTILAENIDKYAAERGQLTAKLEYDFSDSDYTSGDVRLLAYDVTNSTAITPEYYTGFDDDGGFMKTKGGAIAYIPISSSTRSVRLSLYCNDDSATSSTWDAYVDNVTLGPESAVAVPIVTQWQSYTPTFTGFGTTSSVSIEYRRDGPDLLIRGHFSLGTPTATEARLSLPTGLTASSSLASLEIAGQWERNALFSSDVVSPVLLMEPSKTYLTFGLNRGTINVNSYGLQKRDGDDLGASGDVIAIKARIPISGWDTSAMISANEAAVSTIKAQYYNTSSGSYSTTAPLNFSTKVKDDFNAVTTGSSWKFTAPRTNWYRVSINGSFRGTTDATLQIYKNGTAVTAGNLFSYNDGIYESAITDIYLESGDYIDLRPNKSASDLTPGMITIVEEPKFKERSVYGRFEILTATSDTKVVSANGYAQMSKNSITLTAGVWELMAHGDFSYNGNAVGYGAISLAFYASNGADSTTDPTLMTSITAESAGLKVLSSYMSTVVINYDANFASSVSHTSQDASNVIVRCSSSCTVYAVPYLSASTPSNARITVYATAKRLQ